MSYDHEPGRAEHALPRGFVVVAFAVTVLVWAVVLLVAVGAAS